MSFMFDRFPDSNARIKLCTVSSDITRFDMLIDDLDLAYGTCWTNIPLASAEQFFATAGASQLNALIVALDDEDMSQLPMIRRVIAKARNIGLRVLVTSEDVDDDVIAQLRMSGAEAHVQQPAPDNLIAHRLRDLQRDVPMPLVLRNPLPKTIRGKVLGVQSVVPGSGGTTVALNLAWEIAQTTGDANSKTVILDMKGALGAAPVAPFATPWAGFATADDAELQNMVTPLDDGLDLLSYPAYLLPAELANPDAARGIITRLRQHYSHVIINLPSEMAGWPLTLLEWGDEYFGVMEGTIAAADQARALTRIASTRKLPCPRFVLNKCPRNHSFASTGFEILAELPQMPQTRDNTSVAAAAPGSTSHRALRKLAATCLSAGASQVA